MLKHMARRTKVLLAVVVGVPLVIGVLALGYLFFSDLEALKPYLTSYLSKVIGRELAIAGDFRADFGRIARIEATDVSLANAGWSDEPHMVHVDRLVAELDLVALLKGPLVFEDAEIRGARVLFETDEEQRFNWVFSPDKPPRDTPPKPFELLIRHAVLSDVTVAYERASSPNDMFLEIHHLEFTADEREILDLDFDGTFDGEAARLTGTIGTLTGLVNADAVEHDLELRLADATISSAGTIARLGSLSGVDATVAAEGPALERITVTLGVADGVPGPFSSTAELTTTAAGERVDLKASLGGLQVEVLGELDSLVKAEQMELQISAAGPDAAAAASLAGLPIMSRDDFEVSGRLQWSGFPATFDDLRVRIGDNTFTAHGILGEPPHFTETDFRFEGQGPDISHFAALAGVRLPADSFRATGHLTRERDRIRFESFNARIGDASFEVDGSIGDPPNYEGTELTVRGSGPDLAHFSELVGGELPAKPFSVEARLSEGPESLNVTDAKARVGEATLRADGRLRTENNYAGSQFKVTADGPDATIFRALPGLEKLPAERWRAQGELAVDRGEIRITDTSVGLGSLQVAGDGVIPLTGDLVGTDLDLQIDEADLRHLADLTASANLPAEPLEARGRLLVSDSGFEIRGFEATSRDISVTAEGRIGRPPGLDGTELEITARGTGLDRWSDFSGVALPDDRFEADGGLRISDGGYGLEEVTVTLGGTRASLDGILFPHDDLEGTEIRLDVAGERLAEAGRLVATTTGLAMPELPELPFSLSSKLAIDGAAYQVDGLRATLADSSAAVDGRIGRGPRAVGTDLRFSAQGSDASFLEVITGATVPAAPFHLSGGVRRLATGYELDQLVARIGRYRANVDGTVGEWPRLVGTDAVLHASGPSLALVGAFANIHTLPKQPFSIDGRFTGTPDRFTASDIVAVLGTSDLEGRLTADLTATPDIRARLTSKRLVLHEILPASPTDAEESNGGEPRSPRQRVFSDSPLDLAALERANGELSLLVDELHATAKVYRNATLIARVDNGALEVERLQAFGSLDGTLGGSFNLDPRDDGYDLRARFELKQVRLDLEDSRIALPDRPPIDLLFELDGHGASAHEMAASADGRLQFVVGPGTIDSSIVDIITTDVILRILELLNPFTKRSDVTEFQCAVLAIEIEDGVAKLAPIAVQTSQATMLGDGRINLDSEDLRLDWVTKPRKGIGLSASMITNPYIRLGGSLAKPSLELKEMEAVASTGVGVATLGLSFVAKGFFDRLTAERKVCQQALAKIGRQQEKTKGKKK